MYDLHLYSRKFSNFIKKVKIFENMISFNRLPTILLLSFFILFFSNLLNGQETDLLMVNSKKIDQKRYEDVKGNPYLYKKWKKGSIISADADVIENVLLNYNGESNSFEIKKDNRFIELDPRWYVRVLVEEEPDEAAVIFQKNFLPCDDQTCHCNMNNGKLLAHDLV